MNILFAAPENAWGGFLGMVRQQLPAHHFTATGEFTIQSLAGVDVLIPTMCPITRETLADADRLKLIQPCGSGLEGVDITAATDKGIFVANVPTGSSGNADSVAELGIYLMIGLLRDVRGMAQSLANKKMGQPQCLPATSASLGMINRETLACMKSDAFLINLSRGGLVDRNALEWALSNGTIAGAGLDVFWEGPPDPGDPIFNLNVLATPHGVGSTDRSMQGIVAGVVENIQRLEAGLPPHNQVVS